MLLFLLLSVSHVLEFIIFNCEAFSTICFEMRQINVLKYLKPESQFSKSTILFDYFLIFFSIWICKHQITVFYIFHFFSTSLKKSNSILSLSWWLFAGLGNRQLEITFTKNKKIPAGIQQKKNNKR